MQQGERTQVMMKRLDGKGLNVDTKGEMTFGGRAVIHQDSAINKGVSLGASEREAIVVDDEKDPILAQTYNELLKSLRGKRGETPQSEREILQEVMKLTKKKMPVDIKEPDRINDQLQLKPDEKVYLSTYMNGGVCRHQALLAGYLLEKLVSNKILTGSVSIDRNTRDRGGHVWARYTSNVDDNAIYIVDATQDFLGPLNATYTDTREWDYFRKTDTETSPRRVFDSDPFADRSGFNALKKAVVGFWSKPKTVSAVVNQPAPPSPRVSEQADLPQRRSDHVMQLNIAELQALMDAEKKKE